MRVFKTAASAIALCAMLAACGEFPAPQYPVSRSQAPPPQPGPAPPAPATAPAPAAPQDDTPQARPTTGIQQQALPAPPGAKTTPQRQGAALEPFYRQGGAMLMLAAYSPDDEATVYPAAHKRHRKAAASEEAADTATVQKGDTLATIAKAHGTTIDDLAKLNGL